MLGSSAACDVSRCAVEGEVRMYAKPIILPLDAEGRIYALHDEKGNTIGTGTREVCEVLMYMITNATSTALSGDSEVNKTQRPNARAASARHRAGQ